MPAPRDREVAAASVSLAVNDTGGPAPTRSACARSIAWALTSASVFLTFFVAGFASRKRSAVRRFSAREAWFIKSERSASELNTDALSLNVCSVLTAGNRALSTATSEIMFRLNARTPTWEFLICGTGWELDELSADAWPNKSD